MRKLKTIATLLKEYPEAYFQEDGSLNLIDIGEIILPSHFKFFGKGNNGTWSNDLYEPKPERKKLYAFKSKNSNVIYHYESVEDNTATTEVRRSDLDMYVGGEE